MTIFYKKNNLLIKKFCEDFNYNLYTKPSFIQRLKFKKDIKDIDIFFHTGVVLSTDIKLILKSKKIIVQSYTNKNKILDNTNNEIKSEQIDVIYPFHNVEKFKKKQLKQEFLSRYNLNKDTQIIYYTGKNYEKTGLVYFLKIIQELANTNFKGVISGTQEQLRSILPILKDMGISNKIILTQDDIFKVSDIFILPTSNKTFASSILKAMASKNVVFTPSSNHICELLDNFSIMNGVDDLSTSYKIDMLLQNINEIKTIKKQNYQISKSYIFDEQYQKLKLALKL